ncbi:hypothetical protein GJU41_12650 [Bacillus idriensis]|uniref:Uncharacterized protein n=1 Tax=Metabacillus idriensis TaxID=324768 RepID=A0A6I2MBU5_9BACI|nr:hypothetical protein [Metabacillus idriensis]MRX54824.1 hypothetical protein [Metabacillus idriensis]
MLQRYRQLKLYTPRGLMMIVCSAFTSSKNGGVIGIAKDGEKAILKDGTFKLCRK